MEIVVDEKPLALATSRIVAAERFNPAGSQTDASLSQMAEYHVVLFSREAPAISFANVGAGVLARAGHGRKFILNRTGRADQRESDLPRSWWDGFVGLRTPGLPWLCRKECGTALDVLGTR